MSAKILIIEDDEAIIEALKVMLESRGHGVEISEDGDEIVSHIAEFEPDLLILDLYLPGRDGWHIYKSLKESLEFSRLPVIVLSALTKGQIMAAAGKEGEILPEDVVFSKPIDPVEFISKIEELLARN